MPNEPVPDAEEVPTDNEEQPANESAQRAEALAEAGPDQTIGDVPPPPPAPPTHPAIVQEQAAQQSDEPIGEPEQTDNRPRDEDGDQDVNQDQQPAEGSV